MIRPKTWGKRYWIWDWHSDGSHYAQGRFSPRQVCRNELDMIEQGKSVAWHKEPERPLINWRWHGVDMTDIP